MAVLTISTIVTECVVIRKESDQYHSRDYAGVVILARFDTGGRNVKQNFATLPKKEQKKSVRKTSLKPYHFLAAPMPRM